MIYAGCDVGSLTAKAVIFENEKILGTKVIRAQASPVDSAKEVMNAALEEAGVRLEDIAFVVSTGYGKDQIPFANSSRSEIACHGRGAWWCSPTTRTVIDIGGQDAKAIRVSTDGKIDNYRYNDKCASGTGRFLEVMARALEVNLEDMGALGEKSTKKINLSNQCVVFAETEVVSLINEGEAAADIINGLNRSLSNRVAALARSIGIEDEIVFTGGVAKNSGVFKALEEALECTLKPLNGYDPQLTGALGAALLAKEMHENGGKR